MGMNNRDNNSEMVDMRSIPGYPDYFATENGDIISCRSHQHKTLATRIHKGYLHVNIKTGHGRKTQKKEPVHKLVLLAFLGPKPSDGMVCRHLNGRPHDNRAFNLTWGTPLENVLDSIRHGTAICLRLGEDHPCAKLKIEQVVMIKRLIASGLGNVKIAKAIGVERYTVHDIRVGKSWRHVPQGA